MIATMSIRSSELPNIYESAGVPSKAWTSLPVEVRSRKGPDRLVATTRRQEQSERRSGVIATWQSATSSESCCVVIIDPRGPRGSRARQRWAKAMEGTEILESSAEEPSGVGGAECQESWFRNWGDPTRSLAGSGSNRCYKQNSCEMQREAGKGSRRGP